MKTLLDPMESLLPRLLADSLSAGGIALFVLALHVLLRNRLSLRCSHALWCLVFVRLMLPSLPEVPHALTPAKPKPAQVQHYLQELPPPSHFHTGAHSDASTVHAPSPIPSPASLALIAPLPSPRHIPHASDPWTFSEILTLLWISGALTWLATMLGGLVWCRAKWHRHSSPPDERLTKLLAEVCAEVQCRRPPHLFVSAKVRSPLVAGLIHARLYLPPKVAEQFSDRALRFVFLHELGHLRRGDLWINFFAAILQAIHWFNPLVWFAGRRLRAAAELSCDAWVLQKLAPDEAKPYGNALLDLLESQSVGRAWPGTAAMAESKKDLRQRITRISLGRRSSWWLALLSAVVLLATAFIALTAPGQSAPQSPSKSVSKKEEKPSYPMTTTKVRIVDENGKPLPGAIVQMQGFRVMEAPGSGYAWRSSPGESSGFVTNAEGIAVIRYPTEISKDEHLSSIGFNVTHAGFAPLKNHEQDVPSAMPDLKITKGERLHVTAVMGPEKKRQPIFLLQSSVASIDEVPWVNQADGSLYCDQLSAGVSRMRGVWHDKTKDETWFSDMELVTLDGGGDHHVELELKPAHVLRGHLDESVPRPVKGGRVEVYFMPSDIGGDYSLLWRSAAIIKEDGTFEVRDCPPGDDAYLSAFCLGFCSQSDDSRNKHFHVARHFRAVDVAKTEHRIPMEHTASLHVKLVNQTGLPVSGVRVSTWPNTLYGIYSSSFGELDPFLGKLQASQNCAQQLETVAEVSKSETKIWETTMIRSSDARGEALFENFPACKTEVLASTDTLELAPENYGARDYANWRRSKPVTLSKGATTEVNLTLLPKGSTTIPKVEDKTAKASPAESRPPIYVSPKLALKPPSWAPTLTSEPVDADEFAGVVIDSDGKPLAKATLLSQARDSFNEWITADAQGRFRYRIPKANGKVVSDLVRIQAKGCCPLTLMQQPTGVYAFITLKKNTWVEGDVKDVDGVPVKGAAVRMEQDSKCCRVLNGSGCYRMPYREARTDEQGHYKLLVEPDYYSVTVWCKELGECARQKVPVVEGAHLVMDFHADPKSNFEARFVDSITGEPIPDANLKIEFWEIKHSWKAGVDGVLHIKGMLPGSTEFWPDHPAYARWWSEDAIHPWQKFEPENNKQTHWQRNFDGIAFNMSVGMKPVTIKMEKAVIIRGRVLDPDGKPVENATVDPAHTGTGNSLTGDTRFSVKSDAQGRYELHIPASNSKSRYNLTAHDGKYREWRNWANGVLPPMQTRPGDVLENQDIHLTRPGIIRGVLVDDEGKPVADQRVRAEPVERWENRYYNPETVTDAQGRFELKFVRTTKQHVIAVRWWPEEEFDPQPDGHKTVEVVAGQTVEVRLSTAQKLSASN